MYYRFIKYPSNSIKSEARPLNFMCSLFITIVCLPIPNIYYVLLFRKTSDTAIRIRIIWISWRTACKNWALMKQRLMPISSEISISWHVAEKVCHLLAV